MSDFPFNSHDNSGFTVGMFMGILVGGAAGYFLSTEKGKELLGELANKAGIDLKELQKNDTVKEIMGRIQEASKDGENVVDTAATSTAPKPSTRHFFWKSGSRLKP